MTLVIKSFLLSVIANDPASTIGGNYDANCLGS
mgnify:CR=1 FL=1|jgi:hypothetical protein